MIEIEKIEKTKQKVIITSLIISDKFCKDIIPILQTNNELTFEVFSGFYKTVLSWVLRFYKKYEKSPKRDIQGIYETETSSTKYKVADAKLIGEFLQSLSDNFDVDKNYNESYAIDQAKLYLRQINLDLLQKKIDIAKKAGEIEQAEEYIENFKNIEKQTEVFDSVDFFADPEQVVELLSKKRKSLLIVPGEFGKFIGPICREDFVSINSPGKRGKSWVISEIALQAAKQGLRTFIINLEMSPEEYIQRLCMNILGEVSYLEGDFEIVEIPYFEKGSGDKFDIKYKRVKKYGISEEKIAKKIKSLRSSIRSGLLKILSFPTNSLTVSQLRKVLDDEAAEGIFADVCLVDYADIMQAESGTEHRHKINSIWGGLRGLAQEKHLALITGGHTNKSTFNKVIEQGDASEDYRKDNHVTLSIGLNQTPEEKRAGIMRFNIPFKRHGYFNVKDFLIVLQNIKIGKCLIDSKKMKNVNYKNIVEGEDE